MKQVVIIDVDWGRSEAIGKPFEALGCAVTLMWKGGGEEKSKPGNVPPECLLLLHHVGDRGEWKKMPKAEHVIYYSGKAPEGDKRFPKDPHYRVNRPVTQHAGCVKKEEALEILEFVDALGHGGTPQLPQLLTPRRALSLLPTLAILCQGYLFLHALRGLDDEEAARMIESGAERMGWKEILKQRSYQHLLPPDLPHELGRVNRPSWWLQPFREIFPYHDPASDIDSEALREAMKEEWHSVVATRRVKAADPCGVESWEEKWKKIDNLLKWLNNRALIGTEDAVSLHRGLPREAQPASGTDTKKSSNLPKLVAEAYCALADALESPSKHDRTKLAAKKGEAQP
jgi:hypothetical protein